MSLEKDLSQAAKAEKLLKDETLTDAFNNVRQALFSKIEQVPIRDEQGLKELKLMLKLLRDVRANLEHAVRNGRLASEELKISRERKLRLFR